MKQENTLMKSCSECGALVIIQDSKSAEVVCANCGFVLATDMTNEGPEWRAFTPEQTREKVRVGSPQTYMIHDKGLSTKIDWRDINRFTPKKKAQFHRLRRWQQRIRVSNSSEKSLALALSAIHRISDLLNLPKNIAETAAVIYRKAIKKHLIRGRSIRGIATATIYLACRQGELVRTINEMSKASGINRKEITSNYRFLVRKLKFFVPPVKPRQYIARLFNQLGLSGKIEGVAYKILRGAKKQRLTSGRGAKGIAAASSYIASIVTGEHRTQREFAEAVDLTEVTIRNRYKEIMNRLLIVISL
jgi:transcription initiation factor TFIIB